MATRLRLATKQFQMLLRRIRGTPPTGLGSLRSASRHEGETCPRTSSLPQSWQAGRWLILRGKPTGAPSKAGPTIAPSDIVVDRLLMVCKCTEQAGDRAPKARQVNRQALAGTAPRDADGTD